MDAVEFEIGERVLFVDSKRKTLDIGYVQGILADNLQISEDCNTVNLLIPKSQVFKTWKEGATYINKNFKNKRYGI